MRGRRWTSSQLAAALTALLLAAVPLTAMKEARKTRGFDYYVLALSWAPSFCVSSGTRQDNQECDPAQHYAFVVHGLWPTLDQGNMQSCAPGPVKPVAQDVVQRTLPLMPSTSLIQHEWRTHGTCSGLTADYFEQVRRAFQSVTIPTRFNALKHEIMITPSQISKEFADANPSFGADAFRVICGGSELREVRVCFTKELKPRPCGLTPGCPQKVIGVRPVP